jgi:hypothetical protein
LEGSRKIMATQGNTSRPFQTSLRTRFKNKLDERREARLRYCAPFYLLWDQDSSQPKYVKALSNEVSEHGLRLEMTQPILVDTQLSLRSESGALFGGANVRHVTKHGTTYVLGLELSYSLLDNALALVREVYSTPRAR